MKPTEQFIRTLEDLKSGDLGRLRQYAGLPLDNSVDAFDLFAGLWWPLRQKNQRAPRREVAWLIAKLYAFRPMPHSPGAVLASLLGKQPVADARAKLRRQNRFDLLLALPLNRLEPALQWALGLVAEGSECIDWVTLTDDLSAWERERIRRNWAEQYLQLRS